MERLNRPFEVDNTLIYIMVLDTKITKSTLESINELTDMEKVD